MRQYPSERLIKNIGTNNKTVAALLQPRFCAYKKAVIAVRVSGGHLCEAETPTEPAGETAVRRVAILRPCHCEHRKVRGNPFFSFEESTDSFARAFRMTSRLVAASVTGCAVTCRSVIAVRVSGGHLRDAEAPTEPAGETAARRAAIRFSLLRKIRFLPCTRNQAYFRV